MNYHVTTVNASGEYAPQLTFDLAAGDHNEIAASLLKIGELVGNVRIVEITVDRGGRHPATVYVSDESQASYDEFVRGSRYVGSPERITSPETGASSAAWRLHAAGDAWFAA